MKMENIDKFSKETIKDELSRKAYLTALILVIGMIITILGLWNFIPEQVPIFFSRPWGDARIGERYYLFLLPGLGIMVVVINLVITKIVKDISDLLVKALAVGSIGVVVMFSISLFGILRSII